MCRGAFARVAGGMRALQAGGGACNCTQSKVVYPWGARDADVGAMGGLR